MMKAKVVEYLNKVSGYRKTGRDFPENRTMDKIFHEKQEGYLCAQHCLNALLQGPHFNPVDLADLAHKMDEEERIRMAESGVDSEDYRLFMEQPSGNVDDSGYFSVQVISSALEFWGLELVPYYSTEPAALIAQINPSQMKAYICNYRGHWFTIRKLGSQWFNLNSMLSGPQLISETYLAMYLAQLIQEGYSIFIVIGNFPPCEADEYLTRHPVHSPTKMKSNSEHSRTYANYTLQAKSESDSKLLKFALQGLGDVEVPSSSIGIAGPSRLTNTQSLLRNKTKTDSSSGDERMIPVLTIQSCEGNNDGDADLQRALELSLEDAVKDDTARSRPLRLDLGLDENASHMIEDVEVDEEEDELRRALQLSLEGVSTSSTCEQDKVRWRHMPILNISRSNTESPQKLNT